MKITCSTEAYVYDDELDREVAAPQSLGEWSYGEDRLEHYLDEEIADQGVVGGLIRASVDEDGTVQILIDYWSPAALDDDTLELLSEFTSSQLGDGIGEGGFDVSVGGKQLCLIPYGEVEIELSDDGVEVPPPSRVAMSARDGDLAALRTALSSGGENVVDSLHQGYTGLHLAILYGHVDAALLLIARGADVNKTDPMGDPPLILCAAANSLPDQDSARIARALLSSGAAPGYANRSGSTARELAEIRGKSAMVEVLASV